MGKYLFFVFLVLSLKDSIAAPFSLKSVQKTVTKIGVKIGVSCFLFQASPVLAVDNTFQEQLKVIQALQVEQQKIKVQNALSKVDMNRGNEDVIAKGSVMIAATMYGVDASLYPLGFPEASELDPAFANDEATMVITAVGREGPPVAARRLKLKGLQFPMSFELTTADLIFPYNAKSWQSSPLSKDSIAVTCILDTDGQLITPNALDRFGFAISSPAVLGDLNQRSEAKVSINLKSDGHKYSGDELELLSRVDNFLVGLEKKVVPEVEKVEKI
jgi:hypothetical protein